MKIFHKDIEKLSTYPHSFCVPAHKGRGHENAVLDVTEQALSDNAADPQGSLRDSERMTAELFGAGDTLYCTAGSSTAIKAALGHVCGMGGKLTAVVPTHRSLADAASIFSLDLDFVSSTRNKVDPEELRSALRRRPPDAVFCTYADYDGYLLNFAQVVEICKSENIPTVVDNAHGGYLKFAEGFCHPVELGADIVIDSAYKTLGALTPASMLHVATGANTAHLREFVNILSTTSPPYPVMHSLDRSMRRLRDGEVDFSDVISAVGRLKREFSGMIINSDEPIKLAFETSDTGRAPSEILGILDEYGILPELCNDSRLLFVASPFNEESDFSVLEKALREILKTAKQTKKEVHETTLPEMRQNANVAISKKAEVVDTHGTLGRISAKTVAPCPPGTVILYPGELITKRRIEELLRLGIEAVEVI